MTSSGLPILSLDVDDIPITLHNTNPIKWISPRGQQLSVVRWDWWSLPRRHVLRRLMATATMTSTKTQDITGQGLSLLPPHLRHVGINLLSCGEKLARCLYHTCMLFSLNTFSMEINSKWKTNIFEQNLFGTVWKFRPYCSGFNVSRISFVSLSCFILGKYILLTIMTNGWYS